MPADWRFARAVGSLRGNREYFNIAHECITATRMIGAYRVRIAHADGTDRFLTFDEIAAGSRLRHWLKETASNRRPHAFMLEPSLPSHKPVRAMMMGAIRFHVTLFGLDGLRLRIDDCSQTVDTRMRRSWRSRSRSTGCASSCHAHLP